MQSRCCLCVQGCTLLYWPGAAIEVASCASVACVSCEEYSHLTVVSQVMNPMAEARGLSLPLRANLIRSRSTTERDKRLHDNSPRDIDCGIDVSVTCKTTLA